MEHPVLPNTERWHELATQCDEAISKAEKVKSECNWILGDAALEIFPMGKDGVNTGLQENLRLFADELGVSFEKLSKCRDVSSSWEAQKRFRAVNWSVHQVLMSKENQSKIKPGMKVSEARKLVSKQEPKFNAKVEQAKALLKDPDVAQMVMSDHEVAGTIAQAHKKAWDERKDASNNLVRSTQTGKSIIEASEESIFLNHLSNMVFRGREATKVWEKMDDHSETFTDRALVAIAQVDNVLSFLRTLVDSDDLDTELHRLTKGEL